MAIGNVTPDSFFAGSRLMRSEHHIDPSVITAWAKEALDAGAGILDIGACSTRPNSTPATEEEEWRRLVPALETLRGTCPEAALSIDTFRPSIARRAMEQFGAMIINDISGGTEEMYDVVSRFGAPYVFTFAGDYGKLDVLPRYDSSRWILDPGFGFCGGVDADYACLRRMDSLRAYQRPVLAGVSRKSMIYKPLGLTPESCLIPTQALQLYALEHGATILRTHDVRETKYIVNLWERINSK